MIEHLFAIQDLKIIMMPSDTAYLLGLAEEYLSLVAATQGGHGDPDDRPHAASSRAVVHDQLLQTLQLSRAHALDAVAWARATVAAARAAGIAQQGE